MSFNNTIKQIHDSEIFKNFIKNNASAELCVGFFIIDLKNSLNQTTLDYKLGKRVFTFSIAEDGEISLKEDELVENPKFPKLSVIKPKVKIDLKEAMSIARGKAFDEGIEKKFEKIIAIVQNHDGKQVWNLTCILETFIILNLIIDSEDAKIIKFDRKSMGDFIRRA